MIIITHNSKCHFVVVVVVIAGGPAEPGVGAGGRRSSRSRRREHHEPETRYRSGNGRGHTPVSESFHTSKM